MIFNKLEKSNIYTSYIQLVFENMEFMIGDIEVRNIIFYDYYENDISYLLEYQIDELEAYLNGVQIDINDESIFTHEIWDIISNKINLIMSEYEVVNKAIKTRSDKVNRANNFINNNPILKEIYGM